MRTHVFTVALLGCLAAGCSDQTSGARVASSFRPVSSPSVSAALQATGGRLASLPDRGNLVAYTAQQAVHRGASTWHPVEISEARAIRSIAEGGMVIQTPDGHPIQLKYVRHVEHADGNWTWVGRPRGAKPGVETVLTFGPKAVFGTIPDGRGLPLDLTTRGGRTWMVSTDAGKASEPSSAGDTILAPITQRAMDSGSRLLRTAGAAPVHANAARISGSASSAPAASATTIDLVLGYTSAFATRLGGTSGALTRLTHLVDLTNQAMLNSQVAVQVRLVKTVEVNYADATTNRSALFDLSGKQCSTSQTASIPQLPDAGASCTDVAVPASLQPVIDAKNRTGADIAAIVRVFSDDNGTCGVAWLLGAGQTPIDASLAPYALAVVSDSGGGQFPSASGNTCRDDALAHEIGHTLGLQHDVTTAAGNDDTNNDGNTLDPEEYGRFADSFGYRTDSTAGNFYTVLATRLTGQQGYLVYSNPGITFCGGFACGVSGQADNARTIAQTAPIVAAFHSPVKRDFDGDGRSDLLWRNTSTGSNTIWKGADATQQQTTAAVTDVAWTAAGTADFNGDGRADILWRNGSSGLNAIWLSGNKATQQAVGSVTNLQWSVAGVGDFNGDGVADVLWRNGTTGGNAIWLSANKATQQAITAVTNVQWSVASVGDFNGDGSADILWRNTSSGTNALWLSANNGTQLVVAPVTNLNWKVAGVGDFDGDGRSDVLWHDDTAGTNAIWKGADKASQQAISAIADVNWRAADVADYDGDGQADVLWRNASSGANTIWRSGNKAMPMAINAVTNLQWVVMR